VVAPCKSRFCLVIFDNDGVVVDSEPIASRAMSATLTSLGFAVLPDDCDQWLKGGTLERTRQLVEVRFGRRLPGDFEARYTAALKVAVTGQLRPVAGVAQVLDQLRAAAVPYCLASSGRRERVRFTLEAAGMAGRFGDQWWGAEDVPLGRGKPSPDIFLVAAQAMGVAPACCAVVEDSDLGVQAAKAAGMTALGFAARTPAGKLSAADAVFTDMAELPALIFASAPRGAGSAASGTVG